MQTFLNFAFCEFSSTRLKSYSLVKLKYRPAAFLDDLLILLHGSLFFLRVREAYEWLGRETKAKTKSFPSTGQIFFDTPCTLSFHALPHSEIQAMIVVVFWTSKTIFTEREQFKQLLTKWVLHKHGKLVISVWNKLLFTGQSRDHISQGTQTFIDGLSFLWKTHNQRYKRQKDVRERKG